MTIDTAKTLAARHGGQIEREIDWLVKRVEALEAALIRYVNVDTCEYGDGPPCPGDEGVTECCYCQAMGVPGVATCESAPEPAQEARSEAIGPDIATELEAARRVIRAARSFPNSLIMDALDDYDRVTKGRCADDRP
jgi:hypothetical protein